MISPSSASSGASGSHSERPGSASRRVYFAKNPRGEFWGQANDHSSTQPLEVPVTDYLSAIRVIISAVRTELVPDVGVPSIFQPPALRLTDSAHPKSVKEEHATYFFRQRDKKLEDGDRKWKKSYLTKIAYQTADRARYPFDRKSTMRSPPKSKKAAARAKAKRLAALGRGEMAGKSRAGAPQTAPGGTLGATVSTAASSAVSGYTMPGAPPRDGLAATMESTGLDYAQLHNAAEVGHVSPTRTGAGGRVGGGFLTAPSVKIEGDLPENWVKTHAKAYAQRNARCAHILEVLQKEQEREMHREMEIYQAPLSKQHIVRGKMERERAEASDWIMRMLEDYRMISGNSMAAYLQDTLTGHFERAQRELVDRRHKGAGDRPIVESDVVKKYVSGGPDGQPSTMRGYSKVVGKPKPKTAAADSVGAPATLDRKKSRHRFKSKRLKNEDAMENHGVVITDDDPIIAAAQAARERLMQANPDKYKDDRPEPIALVAPDLRVPDDRGVGLQKLPQHEVAEVVRGAMEETIRNTVVTSMQQFVSAEQARPDNFLNDLKPKHRQGEFGPNQVAAASISRYDYHPDDMRNEPPDITGKPIRMKVMRDEAPADAGSRPTTSDSAPPKRIPTRGRGRLRPLTPTETRIILRELESSSPERIIAAHAVAEQRKAMERAKAEEEAKLRPPPAFFRDGGQSPVPGSRARDRRQVPRRLVMSPNVSVPSTAPQSPGSRAQSSQAGATQAVARGGAGGLDGLDLLERRGTAPSALQEATIDGTADPYADVAGADRTSEFTAAMTAASSTLKSKRRPQRRSSRLSSTRGRSTRSSRTLGRSRRSSTASSAKGAKRVDSSRRAVAEAMAAMLDDGSYPESILPTSTAAKAIVRDRPMLNPKHPYRQRAKAAGWLPGDGSGNLAREIWGEGKVLLLKKLSDKDPAHKRWSTLLNRPFL